MGIIFVEHREAAQDGIQKTVSSKYCTEKRLGELRLQSHKSCKKLFSAAKP